MFAPQCVDIMVFRWGVTAVLFGSVVVVTQPRHSKKYERFMQELMKVMTDGRKEGAKRFFVAGDEDDEMKEIYGPQCWYGIDADPGGSRKRCGWKIRRGSTADFINLVDL